MKFRDLFGMQYSSVEVTHSVSTPMTTILRELADYLDSEGETGILTSLTTQISFESEDEHLTTLIWSN